MECCAIKVDTIKESALIQRVLFAFDIPWDGTGKEIYSFGHYPVYLHVTPHNNRLGLTYSSMMRCTDIPLYTYEEFIKMKEDIIFEVLL